MILSLGDVAANETVYIPFHTFDSNDPSASVTITGLAAADIEIYKDGGTTQRASDNGYTLLDTDGIDFDGITGLHGISIDLSDNSDAGFYAAGAEYWVAISSITVDGATINFWAAVFSIERTNGVAAILSDTETVLTDSEAILADTEGNVGVLTDTEAILSDTELVLTDSEAILADTEANAAVLTDTEAILADTEAVLTDSEAIRTVLQGLVLEQGTIGATGNTTTTLHLDGLTYADDEINGYFLAIRDVSNDEYHVREITDWADTGDLATVATLPFTPQASTDEYWLLFSQAGASGAPTAAEVADAVWDEAQSGHTTAGTFGETATEIASILTDSEAILADTEAAIPVLTDTEAILADTEAATAVLADTEAIIADTELILTDSEAILVDSEAILSDTGTDGVALSAAGVDAILDEVYEGTTTFRQFLRLAGSALFGKLSGAGTTTVSIRDEADTKNRIVATVDASGNRSAVTLDKT